ncbi:MAG: ATP-binding protein [Tissierellia bacterium]|nr:ATP-binding protein [Tissierellia bacterium]
MIKIRTIKDQIVEELDSLNKNVIIVYGPRQAGKTTLIESILLERKEKIQKFTGDDLFAQDLFGKNELSSIRRSLEGTELLVIDEAQRIENIGLTLKLIIDNLKIKIIVSGSASFDLANKINEPLTGRTKTFYLYPFSYIEIKDDYVSVLNESSVEEFLRFGMFPAVHNLKGEKEKQDYLIEYINNYLYKDILVFGRVKKPKKILDLLTLLALQSGKEVKIPELASNLSISQKTVESYLDILEKMFVIFNLRGFSRNLRKEVSKMSKYYFYDVGVRNAIIRNFNNLKIRGDAGDIFENWFIVEKMKAENNKRSFPNFYFWRTYDQQEIDLIEDKEGKLSAYECKIKEKNVIIPKDWKVNYPQASFNNINIGNYFNYL